MRARAMFLGLVLVPLLSGAGTAADTYSHQEYFEHYAGTATCLECHREAAEAFFHSQHYQWLGEAPAIAGAKDRKLGKLNTVNDFCTNPAANWIGRTTNVEGKVLARGCSACHAGLGRLPSPELSEEQLLNIDCLICHAQGYRRDVYQRDDGTWEWRPILYKNQRGLDSVAGRITLPQRGMCLRCHANAGGGPNFKRGDIEYAQADCGVDFDVHMATDGADLQCIDCHAGEDHRVLGRGADLSATDSPGHGLDCTVCHTGEVHRVAVLDHHTARVHCTTCHIPTYAKGDPTDLRRDWSTPLYHPDGDKYSATITFGRDVTPGYAWFDGRTRTQFLGEPVKPLADGRVAIMQPACKPRGKGAKIHPFKVHTGRLPVLKDRRWLVPLKVEEFFADGDLAKAVREGAEATYGLADPEVEWVETVRYMGLYHEVAPAAQALTCLDCHREGGRLDWQALGYAHDPLLDDLD
ncbi:MAG: hypothetical protein R3D98_02915 [Candidatus Krumholzibacteriia bacterium]